ncbi:hypothetical protein [Helicobacter sp. T3_23-1056]
MQLREFATPSLRADLSKSAWQSSFYQKCVLAFYIDRLPRF